MKSMIAIPCMDSTYTLFDKCLDNLIPVGEISKTRNAGSLVYISRNSMSEVAVKENLDYILWIDSDMVFSADLMQRLYQTMTENNLDILAPICFRRRAPFNPVIYKKIRFGMFGDNEVVEYDDYPKNSLFEVDGVGFGCVMMKVSVLKEIEEKEKGWFTPYPGFGEDLSFCIRAKRCGYRIWCDSSIKVGHISQTVVDEDTFEQYRKLQRLEE